MTPTNTAWATAREVYGFDDTPAARMAFLVGAKFAASVWINDDSRESALRLLEGLRAFALETVHAD